MDIKQLKGVGPKKCEMIGRMGIRTVEDLIHYFPIKYEIQRPVTPIGELEIGSVGIIKGVVKSAPVNIRRNKLVMTQLQFADESGELMAVWFNQPYLKKSFRQGDNLILKGKAVIKMGRLQMLSPKSLKEGDPELGSDAGLLPVYGLTKGIAQQQMRDLVAQSMDLYQERLSEYLPQQVLDELDLSGYREAINTVHRPLDDSVLARARRRLVFDEFLFFQMGLRMLKEDSERLPNMHPIESTRLMDDLTAKLPYELTVSQQQVLDDIVRDMKGPHAMNRLIQGDVGSGKTIVAVLAVLAMVERGSQSVFMAPTEVLAKQHFTSLSDLLEPMGITVGLLTGSMTAKEKGLELEKLALGDTMLLIGTHALIQPGVDFRSLGLVITDEQHRFGVKQRETIAGKGEAPHVLVMSATPIPRTLALIVYGDMDISVMKELPKGRKPIETYAVGTAYMDRLIGFIEKEVLKGRQCYIIAPMVEEGEDEEIHDVISLTDDVADRLGKHIRIAYIHGRMKAGEKDSIMLDYAKGAIDVLVSTTVVEVGVNVPNASLMIIMNAERFGLAQMHQLRGRVGRGEHQSYCILVSDSKSENSRRRLAIMTESNDGFYIAEEDMKLRGHGDLMGFRQSGLPSFKLADLAEDYETLQQSTVFLRKLLADRDNDVLLEELKTKAIRFMGESMRYIAL